MDTGSPDDVIRKSVSRVAEQCQEEQHQLVLTEYESPDRLPVSPGEIQRNNQECTTPESEAEAFPQKMLDTPMRELLKQARRTLQADGQDVYNIQQILTVLFTIN